MTCGWAVRRRCRMGVSRQEEAVQLQLAGRGLFQEVME
jgi:hypothetical protein